MELLRYLAILRRGALLILLTVGVAVGITVLTADRSSTYTTTAKLYVGASTFSTETDDLNLTGDRAAGLTRLINTFAVMVDSDQIASAALDVTGIPRSTSAVVAATTATPLPDANILLITVSDADPAIAQGLANGVADAFIDKISELEPDRQLGTGDLPSAPAQVFEHATLPTVPSQESQLPRILGAALVGLVASCGLLLLIEYLDVTVKDQAHAEQVLDLPVLAVIPVLAMDPASTARRARPLSGDARP